MVSASYSSTLARGNWDNNGSSQHMGSSSVVTQSGYNFSLPWYRTILDVNIAMFKQRPWRHTGTDITDFFKFWVQRGKLEKLLQLSDKSGLLVHGQQDNYVQRWELSEFIFSVSFFDDICIIKKTKSCKFHQTAQRRLIQHSVVTQPKLKDSEACF
ncbi:uncharacterized protein LOC132276090 isoform X1 [Cornus florida]|uniref:uncharacterized protein LOC132276090 isoform X1 n=1 Tax=Cornus florida TaxID=4283 RepID=UPI00289B92BD|nr:uncharacterized protein LOC132276090 isoform X1 [Cornus florida]XP_059633337.1 uncharacterized protein LOC132276090 isoform X1 [Cornus florida]XP_059633338.1 uncharacterized protein LOC132276090 isoform X1 [Cornus florida]